VEDANQGAAPGRQFNNREDKGMTTTEKAVVSSNSSLRAEGLLLSCKMRLEFLTTIAIEQPDLISDVGVFLGFSECLCDVKKLVELALEKHVEETEATQ
jgi:hypothetical protein